MIGSDKAPVTIIEYASMTCPHCAHFEETTFPELKKRYIDTGKVRYIMREFPLDALAAAGFMLARCAGKDKYMPMIETLFAKQSDWVVQQPLEPLGASPSSSASPTDSFKACLANQKVLDNIQTVRDHAVEQASGQFDADLFHQRQELRRRPLDRQIAKEIDPLSQGRIRVFLPFCLGLAGMRLRRRRACGNREGLDNVAALLRLELATIHCPRRCGTTPRARPVRRGPCT